LFDFRTCSVTYVALYTDRMASSNDDKKGWSEDDSGSKEAVWGAREASISLFARPNLR
jgi:hypothetical protein